MINKLILTEFETYNHMDRKPPSGGKTPKSTLANAGRQNVFDAMVNEFAHNAHINKGKNMSLQAYGVSKISVTVYFSCVG